MIRKIVFITFALFIFAATTAFAGTVELPQTGQTKCYRGVPPYDEIPCAGTGQDGEIRAGVPWPNPRFTVNGDCVTDNLTGLIWPKNGDLSGYMTWYDAIDYANNLSLCGYSDWALPNVNELESLVNADVPVTASWLNTQGFTNVQSGYYWSSTTSAVYTDYAWIVYMWEGFVGNYSKDGSYYVWPVRSGLLGAPADLWKTGQTTSYRAGDDGDLERGVAWPNPRFTVSGDCVTDNLTGLMWDINANRGTLQNLQGALDYANNLTLCGYSDWGYSDWRLPNRKELRSLIDYSNYGAALPTGHPFTNVQSNGNYWSSTTFANFTFLAWLVNMWYGYVDVDGKEYYYYVWPVRSGQVGGPLDVSGCIDLSGSPLANKKVILKQTGELNQTTTTDSGGCYSFSQAVSGKSFTVQINGPVLTSPVPVIHGCADLQGSPMTGRKALLKQKNETNKSTKTGADGCYSFTNAVPDKNFKVLIKGPVVP